MEQEYTGELTPEEEERIVREHEARMEREGKNRSRLGLYFLLVAAVISTLFMIGSMLFLRANT